MKEKFIILLLVFSLTVNLAALITMGYFWGRNDRRGEVAFRGDEPPPLLSELPLNNGQRGKMRELRSSLLREIGPVRDELMTKRGELINLLTIDEPDRKAISQKIREINDLQFQTQHAVIDHLLKEKEFLTQRQQEQYFDFMSRRLCPGRFAMGKDPRRDNRGPGMGRGDRGRRGKGRGERMGW